MKDKNKNNFAEFFKEKRQSKNISLEKLSEMTKIQPYHLEALETGQFDKLPPAIYRAGIFKRISKFLDIDENKIMEAYENETSSANGNFLFQAIDTPINKKKSYFILTPSKLAIFFGALLLALLSGYLWYQFNFLIGPPNLAVKPDKDFVTKDENIFVNGKTDIGVNLTINNENVYVASNGNFEKGIQLAAGLNIIEIKAVNNLGKVSTTILQIFRE